MVIAPTPILIRRDPGNPRRIPFQFIPQEGTTETVSASWAEASTLGRQHPIQQWTKGEQQTLSFEARFFSRHLLENIDEMVESLKRAVQLDPDLGRPPLFDFVWGSFHDVVVVSSVGGLHRAALHPDGSLRDATLAITLRHYEKFDLVLSNPDAKPTNTFYITVREGDSWESLARKLYRKPILGELVRRENPDKPFLQTGQLVTMPDSKNVKGLIVTPRSIPLERTAEGISLRISMFKRRHRTKASTVVVR
jgi:hypothetical protein